MTKVRDARVEDLPFLLEKAIAFNSIYTDMPLNEKGTWSYIRYLIEDPSGVVLVTDTGAIAGIKLKDPRWDWTVLVETAWYSEGREGLRLLAEFERRGKYLGCDEVRMTTLAVNSGVDRLLSRRGYKPIETSHRLIL